MKRIGMLIGIRPEKVEEYKALHVKVWPEVLAILKQYQVSNYSIFLKDNWLFGYLEYHGENYKEDMKKLAENEITQRWWKLTEPCQIPLASRKSGEWWAEMESVFYMS